MAVGEVRPMLRSGVYYFWLQRSYPWGDIGRSITQWIFVGLNRKFCDSGQHAFAASINQVEIQPWGYTCYSSPVYQGAATTSGSIDQQLALISNDVKNQVQLHVLATHLRPLETANYWSSELQTLLEKFLEIEELVYQDGLKRKCEWLLKFIEKNHINLTAEGVTFALEQYGQGEDKRVAARLPKSFSNPATEWVMRRVSIKPKGRGAQRRIQAPDVILYYPVFKVLIPDIDSLVAGLGVQEQIRKRWGV